MYAAGGSVDLKSAENRLSALLKKLGAPGNYAASRVTFIDASGWDKKTFLHKLRGDMGGKQALKSGVLAAQLGFLNQISVLRLYRVQRQPKNMNAARLTSPLLMASDLDESVVHQIEAWLASKGYSDRLSERFAAMIQAVRRMAESA